MTNEQKARGFINKLVELDMMSDKEHDIQVAIKGLTQLLEYVEQSTIKEIEALEALDLYNL